MKPAHSKWTQACFQRLTHAANLVFPPRSWRLFTPLPLSKAGQTTGGWVGGERLSSVWPCYPDAPGTCAAGGSGRHHPSRPFPSTDAPATHKLEDEEQVWESGEDREAAGQGAAPRRRCGGHAGVQASASGLDARGSGLALTARLLCGAQWPGRPRARVKSRGAPGRRGRSRGHRPPCPRPSARGAPPGIRPERRGCRPDSPGGRAAGLGRCGREMGSWVPPPTPPPTWNGTKPLRRGASHALHVITNP